MCRLGLRKFAAAQLIDFLPPVPIFYLRLPARARPTTPSCRPPAPPPPATIHLERAHILGPRWALPHTHLLTLRPGLRTRDGREVLGQLVRIAGGFFLSLVGRVPNGNTGGANVSAEQPMPIPADLQAILASSATA